MRQAGTLPTPDSAQQFVDYLLSQGIAAKTDADGNTWAIWIRDEDQLPHAISELRQFAADPNSARYAQATQTAQWLRKNQEREDNERRKNMIEVRDRWNLRTAGRRPLTMILMAACVVVFIGTDGGANKNSELMQQLWFSPPPQKLGAVFSPTQAIEQGQVWRLVTPIFIHYSPMHIIFDLYMFYLFGSLIEVRRGTLTFGLLVLVTALVSNYCEYYVTSHFSWAGPTSIFFGGMSGVDYGLFGYLWIKGRFDPTAGFYLTPSTVAIFLIWLVLCFTGLFGPIANWAHCGGLVAGCVAAYAPVAWRKFV